MMRRRHVVAVLVALAIQVSVAAQGYNLTILQGFGGAAGANSIDNRGWVAGTANNAGNPISHATLWIGGSTPVNLGTLGAPDLNSAIGWPVKRENGLIVGI